MGIVDIPGQPGEKIDARILPDVGWILKTFKVKITDGYGHAPHSPTGEHPQGLAVDIVPDYAKGGTWQDVDRLAKLAQRYETPDGIFPFVGWNGTPGHGDPAHAGGADKAHLHLSWNSPKRTGKDAQLLVERLVKGGSSIDPGHLVTEAPEAALDAADAAAGAVGNVVTSALGKLWDEISGTLARAGLTVALVLAGLTLLGVGLARTAGARTPSPTGA